MTFNPAGTVTLSPMPTDVYSGPQTAGLVHVDPASKVTLTDLTVTGDVTLAGIAAVTSETSVTATTYLISSAATGLTAHAGGGQSKALQLAAQFNQISVCATDGDSVVLPDVPAGTTIRVRNDGAKNAQVYALTPGTINAVATGTGVTLNAASTTTYTNGGGTPAGWFSG